MLPTSRRRVVAVLAACAVLPACSSGAGSGGNARTPGAAPSASGTPTAGTPTAVDYGGEGVRWPAVSRTTPPPPPLGAVQTTTRVGLTGGGTLAARLTLPRVGGSAAHPTVLTPCGRTVTIGSGRLTVLPARRPGERLVVLDPGHGGQEQGALAPGGTRESVRVLQLARLVRDDLDGRVDRVVMTRDADVETTLGFRVALADALRASLAVSLHLNAAPETTRTYPGTSVYGALSDPDGRRAAGVLYQAVRHYLEPLGDQVGGVWAANRDSGALYRRGEHGDYYFLLRRAHVTWAIVESLYLTRPAEARLIARPDVQRGLAGAIAAGVLEFLTTDQPGSGWRQPVPRPADAAPPASTKPCVDPA